MGEWKSCELRKVGELRMGQSPPGSLVHDLRDGLPFLQGNAEFGAVSPEPKYECDLAPRRAVAGDVLISVRAPVGALNRANGACGIGRGLAAVRFTDIDERFGAHALAQAAPDLQRVSQGTTFAAIGRVELGSLMIRVPPLEEQRRIAEILDTIDETIQATERVIAKLTELRRALLLSILDSYFPGRGPIRERVARSTAECTLLSALIWAGDVALGRGNVISAIDIAADPGPYPIYSSSASATGEFGRYGKFMFDEELITWSVDGGGRPFHRPQHRFSVTNVGGFLRIRKNELWSYKFIHALMEAQHAQLSFDWLMKAHPSVIRELYWFPKVPLIEQQQITIRLDVADDSLQREREKRQKLVAVRSGLAADLLSGCVRTMVP